MKEREKAGEKPEKKSDVCPECGGSLVRDYKHAEITCSMCGLVVDENIADLGAETRSFDSDSWIKKTRTGSPMTYTKPHKGLTTEIDKYDRDIRGGTVSKEARKRMYRMRKWQRRINVSSSVEKDIIPALNEISRELSELGLPISMKEDAAIMYRKICNRGLVRGRSIEAIIAAITYILCRERNIPRTLGEIADVSGIDPKDVGKTYRYVARHLTIKVPPTTPSDYLPKFAANVGLPNYVVDKAKEIIADAKKMGLTSGRAPAGVAAAVLYIAADIYNMQKTQKEIADAACVTEVTVRNRHRELEEKMDLYKYKQDVLRESKKGQKGG
ncbi:MAG: transcription initiation factor IIB [Candidatus Altiarchaeota archaeon]|nr:transcription initiation factor IIB [Candidatus Altiarchaeota archaeon]